VPVTTETSNTEADGDRLGYNGSVFFFSNRLGCLGSLLVSVVITVALIWLLKR
jgi:hypothetical protein